MLICIKKYIIYNFRPTLIYESTYLRIKVLKSVLIKRLFYLCLEPWHLYIKYSRTYSYRKLQNLSPWPGKEVLIIRSDIHRYLTEDPALFLPWSVRRWWYFRSSLMRRLATDPTRDMYLFAIGNWNMPRFRAWDNMNPNKWNIPKSISSKLCPKIRLLWK